MALSNLAVAADLTARGIIPSTTDLRDAMLASASAAIRDAAWCSITQTTGTIAIQGDSSRWLRLPGYAVSAVSAVTIEDEAITDYTLNQGALYRGLGWGNDYAPTFIAVTYTQGLADVPADIVDLTCSLVAAGVARAADGYDPQRGVSSERLDDYQRSFTRGADEVVAPMELPPATRSWLAARFGAGSHVAKGLA